MAEQPMAILLVEDNPDDADLTIRALRRGNISNEIVLTRNGAEAREYLFGTGAHAGRNPADPPKVDGMEALRRIRGDERTRSLPVVILTSSDEQRDVVDSYHLGANSYVRKPGGFAEFTKAVRQLGLCWVLINRPPPAGSWQRLEPQPRPAKSKTAWLTLRLRARRRRLQFNMNRPVRSGKGMASWAQH